MCLLVGQGSIVGALLRTANFLHPGHYGRFPRVGEGTVILGIPPWGCEDTVVRRWLLLKGEGT